MRPENIASRPDRPLYAPKVPALGRSFAGERAVQNKRYNQQLAIEVHHFSHY